MPQAKTGGSEPSKPAARRTASRSAAAKPAAARATAAKPAAKPAAAKATGKSAAAKKPAAKTTASGAKSSSTRASSTRASSTRTTTPKAAAKPASSRASSAKQAADARVEAAAQRLRKLNERIIEVGREAGESTLATYERALKAIAAGVEKTPAKDEAEWVAHVLNSQAKFIRDLTDSWAKAAKQRLK